MARTVSTSLFVFVAGLGCGNDEFLANYRSLTDEFGRPSLGSLTHRGSTYRINDLFDAFHRHTIPIEFDRFFDPDDIIADWAGLRTRQSEFLP